MAHVFISHSSKDKDFVRQLSEDLRELGHTPWLDEWEIQVGDCIVRAVGEGLARADFVVVVLSPNSVESGWVEREWAPSYWNEIETKRRIVLPVMWKDCTVPTLLKTKKYADFRKTYAVGFAQLTAALGPLIQSLELPAEQELPPRDDDVLALLTKVQARSSTLAGCLAEGLALASRRGDAALRRFCERELGGYTPTTQTGFSDAENPEAPVNVYSRADAHANVLEAIRSEFTRRLLQMLPSAPDVHGTV